MTLSSMGSERYKNQPLRSEYIIYYIIYSLRKGWFLCLSEPLEDKVITTNDIFITTLNFVRNQGCAIPISVTCWAATDDVTAMQRANWASTSALVHCSSYPCVVS